MLLTVFQKVCDALAFAHSRHVIHRDLKPENIMLGDFGSVLVMDWGLAKILGKKDAPSAGNVASARDSAPALDATMAGTIMGTPQYMAPEQARGEVETMDHRADIYALGAILYTILALRPPVEGTDAWDIVGKVGRGEIDPLVGPPRRGGPLPASSSHANAKASVGAPGGRALPRSVIPESLAAVVKKAMALHPSARYRSVEELQADILAYQNGFATGAERAGWFKRASLAIKRNKAASIGVAAVLLIGGGFGTKALLEGRRAEQALADLKKSAPALLQLAESEADSQRFDSALGEARRRPRAGPRAPPRPLAARVGAPRPGALERSRRRPAPRATTRPGRREARQHPPRRGESRRRPRGRAVEKRRRPRGLRASANRRSHRPRARLLGQAQARCRGAAQARRPAPARGLG